MNIFLCYHIIKKISGKKSRLKVSSFEIVTVDYFMLKGPTGSTLFRTVATLMMPPPVDNLPHPGRALTLRASDGGDAPSLTLAGLNRRYFFPNNLFCFVYFYDLFVLIVKVDNFMSVSRTVCLNRRRTRALLIIISVSTSVFFLGNCALVVRDWNHGREVGAPLAKMPLEHWSTTFPRRSYGI